MERGRLSIKSMSSQGDEDDGFECQKMYGALGGSPKSWHEVKELGKTGKELGRGRSILCAEAS